MSPRCASSRSHRCRGAGLSPGPYVQPRALGRGAARLPTARSGHRNKKRAEHTTRFDFQRAEQHQFANKVYSAISCHKRMHNIPYYCINLYIVSLYIHGAYSAASF